MKNDCATENPSLPCFGVFHHSMPNVFCCIVCISGKHLIVLCDPAGLEGKKQLAAN